MIFTLNKQLNYSTIHNETFGIIVLNSRIGKERYGGRENGWKFTDTEMIHDVGVNERPQFTDLRDNL